MSMEHAAFNSEPLETPKPAKASSEVLAAETKQEEKKEGEFPEAIQEELDREMTADEQRSLARFEDRLAMLKLGGKEAGHPDSRALNADILEQHGRTLMALYERILASLPKKGEEEGHMEEWWVAKNPQTKYIKALYALKVSI